MAKSKNGSKSSAIKAEFAKGNVSTKDVVATLAKRGIKVSLGFGVATQVEARLDQVQSPFRHARRAGPRPESWRQPRAQQRGGRQRAESAKAGQSLRRVPRKEACRRSGACQPGLIRPGEACQYPRRVGGRSARRILSRVCNHPSGSSGNLAGRLALGAFACLQYRNGPAARADHIRPDRMGGSGKFASRPASRRA